MHYSGLRKLIRRVKTPEGACAGWGPGSRRVRDPGQKQAGPTGPGRGKAMGILNFLLSDIVDEHKCILLHLHRIYSPFAHPMV